MRMFYEAWKHGNFTTAKAAEVLSSEGIAAYFGGIYLLSVCLRLRVRLWPLSWSLLADGSCGYLFFFLFGIGYNSRAYFQRYNKVTHTQKYAETLTLLRSR